MAAKALNQPAKNTNNLLSEIAEEDDVSSISETLRYQNGITGSGKKAKNTPGAMLKGSFSNNSKASIHSLNNQA